jgi:hypothetical protein
MIMEGSELATMHPSDVDFDGTDGKADGDVKSRLLAIRTKKLGGGGGGRTIEPSEGWYLTAGTTIVVIATTAGLRRLRELAQVTAPRSPVATGLND